MSFASARPVYRVLEFVLWVGGLLGAGYIGFSTLRAQQAVAASRQIVQRQQATDSSPIAAPEMKPVVMGRLTIPAIKLAVPLISDYDTSSLLKGVGHIPGTALPGGLGTMGLAGHRDTWFRPLRRIGRDMEILVTDASGTYHYRVDSTEIVMPEQVEVLDIVDRPGMALVTCYPFDFIGAAPKRFIVHAHLVSASPDAR